MFQVCLLGPRTLFGGAKIRTYSRYKDPHLLGWYKDPHMTIETQKF
jgi:hypothetical protein